MFPAGAWPDWAVENMWAPEIHFVNGTFVVYFTGGSCTMYNVDIDSFSKKNCVGGNLLLWAVHRVHVGVAVSLSGSPWGPYADPLGIAHNQYFDHPPKYSPPSGSPLVEEPLSLTGAIDPHFFRSFSSCSIHLSIVDKCSRDPVSEENFLLWRTDNMWSSDPEDRAIVYIRKLAEDGLAFDQVPSQSFFSKDCQIHRRAQLKSY